MPGVSFASHVQAFSTLHDAAVFAQTADGRPYSHSFKVVCDVGWVDSPGPSELRCFQNSEHVREGEGCKDSHVVDVVDDDYP